MNPPTPHATAVQFGLLVREEAARNGGDKWKAARIVAERFPTLSADKLTFLTWAFVQAEGLAFQECRPVVEERRWDGGAQDVLAPHHGPVQIEGGGDHPARGPQNALVAAVTPSDGGAGRQPVIAAQSPRAPRTPVRSFFQSSPGAYLVTIGNTGARKPVRDLTRADITTIYRYFGQSESTYRDKREGWQRLAEQVPEDGTLGAVMSDLPTRDRAFLYGEIGLRAEEGAA